MKGGDVKQQILSDFLQVGPRTGGVIPIVATFDHAPCNRLRFKACARHVASARACFIHEPVKETQRVLIQCRLVRVL